MRYSKHSRYSRQYSRAYSRWSANKRVGSYKRATKQSGKLFGFGLGKPYSARGNGYFHKRHY